MDDKYINSSREDLIAEIERLRKENLTLKYSINIYKSVLASIRDTAKKYVPEVSDMIAYRNTNISY